MQLSNRLLCAAQCVTPGNNVADIGCDHAYTSIYLVKNHIAPRVLAMDINRGPLRIAEVNIMKNNCQSLIELRQSNGIQGLTKKDNVKSVLISGMGGNLICDIISFLPEKAPQCVELILQPQSDVFRVRKAVHALGFRIAEEIMIYEEEKYYTIIKAGIGLDEPYDELEYLYGKVLIKHKDKILYQYLEGLHKKNTKILQQMVYLSRPTENQKHRCEEIEYENRGILSILENFSHI